MIKEITEYTANKASLIVGNTIHAGFFPQDAIDDCSIILDNGGPGDYYLLDKLELTIQVITRGFDYHETEGRAKVIYGIFNGGKWITLSDEDDGIWIINSSSAIQSPAPVGQDDKNRFEFSANYILRMSRP